MEEEREEKREEERGTERESVCVCVCVSNSLRTGDPQRLCDARYVWERERMR